MNFPVLVGLFIILGCSSGNRVTGTSDESDLEFTSSLSGRLVDGKGAPAESASVSLLVNGSEEPDPVRTVLADSTGFYHFDSIPFGHYRILGQKAAYSGDTLSLLSDIIEYTKSIYIGIDTLDVPGTIIGRVNIPDAGYGSLVFVTVYDSYHMGIAESDSLFTIKKVPRGVHTLKFYTPFTADTLIGGVEVYGGDTTDIGFVQLRADDDT